MIIICPDCKREIPVSKGVPERREIDGQGREKLRFRCKCGFAIELVK